MIELITTNGNVNITKSANGSISLTKSVGSGGNGGYYVPSVDEEGNLNWTPTKETMEPVEESNIKGPKGDKGDSGVYVGSGEMPEGYDIQIDIEGEVLVYKPVDKTADMTIPVGVDENGQLWTTGPTYEEWQGGDY